MPRMKGVRFFGTGCRTNSVVMSSHDGSIRFLETIHPKEPPGKGGGRVPIVF